MNNVFGTILRVDLSSGKIEKEPISESMRRNYGGGRGINSRILFDETGPHVEPLSPENRLIFHPRKSAKKQKGTRIKTKTQRARRNARESPNFQRLK